jgi:YVTN family beta-propeller protein
MATPTLSHAALVASTLVLFCTPTAPASAVNGPQHPITELHPTALLHIGKTADWVAFTADAVWVGSTGPDAVSRIDPKTNTVAATVKLGGEPCAGLAVGLGAVWVPLCAGQPRLAKIDAGSGALARVFDVGPAAAEGGVTTGGGSVWLVVDAAGTLARIDPETGAIRQKVALPAGSYNPRYADGRIWVTRAGGAEVTVVDAASGKPVASAPAPGRASSPTVPARCGRSTRATAR